MAHTQCGTHPYIAPEVSLFLPYTYKVDLWSLGAILYRMIAGEPLPPLPPIPLLNVLTSQSSDSKNPFNQMLSASLRCTISPSLLDLLDRLLQPNPETRIDWNAFLAHPFVASLTSTPPHNLSITSASTEPPFPHLYPPQNQLLEPCDETLHKFESSAFDKDRPSTNNHSTKNANVTHTHILTHSRTNTNTNPLAHTHTPILINFLWCFYLTDVFY